MEVFMEKLTEIAKRVVAVGLDVDGTFFGGQVLVDEAGDWRFKERFYADGLGVLLLLAAGIHVAFITREQGKFIEGQVQRFIRIAEKDRRILRPTLITGVTHRGKADALVGWLGMAGLEKCAYMGDDLPDYAALRLVREEGGLAAAPAQAEEEIKAIVNFVTPREGGRGAVRDLANLILKAKGIDPAELEIPV